MKLKFKLLVSTVLFSSVFSYVHANEPNVTPSFQGYAGYYNVPTAYSVDDGDFGFSYSTFTELETLKPGRKIQQTPNFQFIVNLWNTVEISARNAAYTEKTSHGSDLSANIKFIFPYIPDDWFKLAVGWQDVGGEVSFFGSKYIALSKHIEALNLEATIGAASSDSFYGRNDGPFAGVKWSPVPWASLLLEHDGGSTNYGVEINKKFDLLGSNYQVFAKTMLGASNSELQDNSYFNVGFKSNLYQGRHEVTPAQISEFSPKSNLEQTANNENLINILSVALARKGFDQYRIGSIGSMLVVEVENNAYSGNHIDTFSVVLALITSYVDREFDSFAVNIKQADIVIDTVSGSIEDYRAFLRGGELKIAGRLNSESQIAWYDEARSFFLKPKFTLYPHLSTTVGSDAGMFDYSLALATHVELPIPVWPGLTATAFHLTQLTESSDFRDGKWYANFRQKSGIHNVTLNQAISLPYNTNALLTYGTFAQNYTVSSAEIGWQTENGRHQFFLYSGSYKYKGQKEFGYDRSCVSDPTKLLSDCYGVLPQYADKKVNLAKYRYYSPLLNTSFYAKYGTFWSNDKGLHLLVSRYFDDFEINLSFKATKPDGEVDAFSGGYEYKSTYTKMLGLGFTMNFGPRKDFNSRYVNIRSRADWSYSVHTLVGEDANYLTFGIADEARTFYHLDNHFNNFGRKGTSYLQRHQDRLRAAYFEL
ncbi:YjbH domain-containing protein [Catenovulum sp. SX2]|uniref:YjbH domain-containing protein n=1 Tax=Catenovulum sp. SX2 TaxID=3398614 RepID=UPI003F86ED09